MPEKAQPTKLTQEEIARLEQGFSQNPVRAFMHPGEFVDELVGKHVVWADGESTADKTPTPDAPQQSST